MNLASLDLNLLVTLDALMSEAHVGRAAARIGLSQPAASHSLRRLREIFRDPLLVRVGLKMELTPRAQALRLPLAQALDQVRGLFAAKAFDPATSTRRFLLMLPDLVADILMPPLLKRISEEAPKIRLDVTPWRSPPMMTDEFVRSVDLAICCVVEKLIGFHRQRLYSDTDVLAVRQDHPVGSGLNQLDAFLDARHVAVVAPGRPADHVDTWLREKGIERRIALAVPSYLQALRAASLSDFVAFVPARLVAALTGPLSLLAVAPPVDAGVDEQVMFYPRRAQFDPASVWLRSLVSRTANELPDIEGLGLWVTKGTARMFSADQRILNGQCPTLNVQRHRITSRRPTRKAGGSTESNARVQLGKRPFYH
jgi:DNA-binding transcriptional LysR family regulator